MEFFIYRSVKIEYIFNVIIKLFKYDIEMWILFYYRLDSLKVYEIFIFLFICICINKM